MVVGADGYHYDDRDRQHRAVLEEASKIGKEVGKTVEQLHDIEQCMRSESFHFGSAAYEHIGEVGDTLKQLEKCCHELRESLEAETIICSTLRHEKAMFPIKLRREVDRIMLNLREDNEKQLSEVKGRLDAVESRIAEKEKRLQFVRDELKRCKPEIEKSQQRHAHDVEDLNQIMAEKAKWRICLNKTIAMDEKTVKKREKVDKQMDDMRIALEQERLVADSEMADLKRKALECKEQVDEKESEIYTMERELQEVEVELNFVQADVRKKETEREVLKNAVRQVLERKTTTKVQLDTACLKVLASKRFGRDIVAAQKAETEAHNARMQAFQKEEDELHENIQYAKEEMQKLSPQFHAVKKAYDRSMKHAETEGGKLTSLETTLGAAKVSLVEETQDCAKTAAALDEANADKTGLEQALAAHVAFSKESITRAKDRLVDKRARKLQVLHDRDRVMAEKSTQEAGQNQAHLESAVMFDDTVKTCKSLESAVSTNTKRLKSGSKQIRNLRHEFATLRKKCDTTRDLLSAQLKTLVNDVDTLSANMSTNEARLEELKPAAESIREECETAIVKYDDDKKKAIELKNKRASYQDRLVRADREIEQLHIPQDRLRTEMRAERSAATDQLQEQSAETNDIEKRVWTAKRRVATLATENRRFVEAITSMDDECLRTQRKMETSASVKQALANEVSALQATLKSGWASTRTMEQDYSKHDKEVISRMETLMAKLHIRGSRVTTVEERLKAELQTLGQAKDGFHL